MNRNQPVKKLVDEIWNDQSYGDSIKQNIAFIDILQENRLALFMIGKSYFFLSDIKDVDLNNFSKGTKDVLGYEPDEMSMEKMLSLVHPIDLPVVIANESKVREFFNGLSPEKIFKYKIRYDYRLKHKEGHYIRVLQQMITIETDDKGAIVKTMGIHSDITDLKKEGLPVLSFIGLDGEPTYENVQVESKFSFLKPEERFSPREKEILNKLIQGKTSEEIPKELFISRETVSTHRRNMLSKCDVKNTLELVNRSIKNGWV
jgi:DNA-binding CsgD family transcriptional regulator